MRAAVAFLVIFLNFITSVSFAQKDKRFLLIDSVDFVSLSKPDQDLLDSILPLYHKSNSDTQKINYLGIIVESSGDDAMWPKYNALMYEKVSAAISKASTLKKEELLFYKSKLADAVNNFGFLKLNDGNVKGALSDFSRSLMIQEDLGNRSGMASALSNMGYIYKSQGDIFKALEHYSRALKLFTEINDKQGLGNTLNNVGLIYKNQGDLEKALEYYQQSLKLMEEIGNKSGIAACLNNLGFIFRNNGDNKKALEYYYRTLKIDEELGERSAAANTYNNIAILLEDEGKIDEAHSNFLKGLSLCRETGSKKGTSEILNNLGRIYLRKGLLDSATYCGTTSLNISRALGYPVLISSAAELLSNVHRSRNNWKEAFEMQSLHMQMKDSVLNDETQKTAARQQLKYELERQKELNELETQKKNFIIEEEKKRQRLVNFATGGGLILMIVFAGFIYSRFRISQRQKLVISMQKQQVDLAYDQVSEKNREILDSIRYAKKIQTALLKEEEHVSSHLPEHFVLFKPKDIVSGDFYWSYERDGYWYLAAADCTGHGVPGAFLTMLGTAFLNEIVARNILSPSEILEELRHKVIKELSQSSREEDNMSLLKDGMDMSLFRMNLQSREIQWAGANNGLWICRKEDGEIRLHTYAPDKQPIGYFHKSVPFTNHDVHALPGDQIYLYTDGFADQFGGPQGKKMKLKALQEMLITNAHLPMASQKEALSGRFDDWKGKLDQVDDVTLIGVRL